MSGMARLITTLGIWSLIAAMVIMMFLTNMSIGHPLDITNLIITLLLGSAGVTVTLGIWNWGNVPALSVEAQKQQVAKSSEKSKRDSRIQTLLDDLSEDEVLALRRRLMAIEDVEDDYSLGDDGELVQQKRRR